MKLVLFAGGAVGLQVYRFLAEQYPGDIGLVVTSGKSDLSEFAHKDGFPTVVYSNDAAFANLLSEKAFDLGLLCWWPYILSAQVLRVAKRGFINFHPSLLPHNRGKHYNFWALVEQRPFGVTLHYVDDGIDSGDIVAQREIHYDWTDTGGTLYAKAQREIVALFRDSYELIRLNRVGRIRQNLSAGSFHLARELEPASLIHLDRPYRARDLLNLIRARTFQGHPACYFVESGEKYEVRLEIRKVQRA